MAKVNWKESKFKLPEQFNFLSLADIEKIIKGMSDDERVELICEILAYGGKTYERVKEFVLSE